MTTLRRYVRFATDFWAHPRVRPMPLLAKMLFAFLITHPEIRLTGIVKWENSLFQSLFPYDQWGALPIEKALTQLEKGGHILREGEYVWVRQFTGEQGYRGSRLESAITKELKEMQHVAPALVQAFREEYGNGQPVPSETGQEAEGVEGTVQSEPESCETGAKGIVWNSDDTKTQNTPLLPRPPSSSLLFSVDNNGDTSKPKRNLNLNLNSSIKEGITPLDKNTVPTKRVAKPDAEEEAWLSALKAIETHPYEHNKDLIYLRKLRMEFPDVDIGKVIGDMEAWLLDHPNMKSGRLRLRNFCLTASGRRPQSKPPVSGVGKPMSGTLDFAEIKR